MKKLTNIIVEKKNALFILYAMITLLCLWGMLNINVNYDMSKYLPDDSEVKIGMEQMEEDFGATSSITVMFKDLTKEERQEMVNNLKKIKNVDSVTYYESSESYQKGNYSKYVITMNVDTYSKEARDTVEEIKDKYDNAYLSGEVVNNDLSVTTLSTQIPVIALVAVIVIFTILFILSDSWVEPLIFMGCIGIAILINMGTNALLPSVSFMTNAVGALLQMGLSMDYSIMLMNSYNRHKKETKDRKKAMKNALRESFSTITSSSVTTIVGLVVLVFMSFKIGADMGIVLAKGILISLITIFTLLPGLVLTFDKLIAKTKKKSLNIKMDKPMEFINKSRNIILVIAVLLVGIAFVYKNDLNIGFLNSIENKDEEVIENVFGKENQTILLYDKNESKDNIDKLTKWLDSREEVTSVNDYYNTIGTELTYKEFAYSFGIDEQEAITLYQIYNSMNKTSNDITTLKVSLDYLLTFVNDNVLSNENYASMIPDNLKTQVEMGMSQIKIAKNTMVGKKYNRMVINTNLSAEGKETYKFIENTKEEINKDIKETSYLIGNSAMANEMNNGFNNELNFVTILSVIAIFVIVLFTFKNILSSLVLVLTIQSAIIITTMIVVLQGMTANYIALILVQCILMGATIDYGILFLNHYLEIRKEKDKKEALIDAMNKSIKTIITSSLILIGCCLSVAFLMTQEVISSTCMMIAYGTLCAVIMIIFVLPAITSLCDKYIIKKS